MNERQIQLETVTKRSDSQTNPNSSTDEPAASSTTREPIWDAVVEHYDDQPDLCTIFPVAGSSSVCESEPDADIDVDDLCTTWISASEGSFVELEEWR